MNATKQRVELLKSNNEDFEFYPTTNEIINVVAARIAAIDYRFKQELSILDIGAGDGRVLESFAEQIDKRVQLFAIEKAHVHLAAMPKRISIVGTDFNEQSLVGKNVDVTFCNPPYSEYEHWASRIIRESSSSSVFLVIPKRWRNSDMINNAIEAREATVSSLGEFDFLDADRAARAKVEILLVNIDRSNAFYMAIEEMLPELKAFDSLDEMDPDEIPAGEVVEGGSVIKTLVRCYDEELDEMYSSYRSIVKIKVKLLKELGVTKDSILEGLRLKINGLKSKYWSALFNHLNDVTKRLATKQRKQFLESLKGKGDVDFTESNALAMLIWISKHASSHFDQQLIDLFKRVSQRASVIGYKSNERVFSNGDWRYLRDDETHYKVDFRIILESMGGINDSMYKYNSSKGLCNTSHEFLDDFVTVANNLGFECNDRSINYEWKSNKKVVLNLVDGSVLMEVRAFKNGNLHLKISKDVMLAINVQAGKLLGWLRSADEAADELGAKPEDVERLFLGSSCVCGVQLKLN